MRVCVCVCVSLSCIAIYRTPSPGQAGHMDKFNSQNPFFDIITCIF